MTASDRSRTGAASRRRRWAGALASALATASLLLASGDPVGADQTIYYDDAGDAPHIGLIGDSTLTGVRWYGDYGALERYNFVFSAESCRRTIEASCISREGYRSQNVIAAMNALDGELGEVLVVMSGYNDPAWTIDEAIDGVVTEARSQGIDHVVWLTLRTSDDVEYSDPQEQSSINTFREYNEQLVTAAAESDGFLQVADWATYSNGASGWFESDGVHLTIRGVDAVTTFIAGIVERVLAGEDVSPAAAPWTVLVPGADGEIVTAVQEALIEAGIDVAGGADGVYGNSTMLAVAEYQRGHGELQETGAVDVATAQALGVYVDPDAPAAAPTTTTSPAPTSVAAPPSVAAPSGTIAAGEESGDQVSRWLPAGAAGIAIAAVAALVLVRRRRLASGRAGRRWARVHPSTSPRRSVADMRRSGDLPPQPSLPAQIYDHEREDPAEDEITGELPVTPAGAEVPAGAPAR